MHTLGSSVSMHGAIYDTYRWYMTHERLTVDKMKTDKIQSVYYITTGHMRLLEKGEQWGRKL